MSYIGLFGDYKYRYSNGPKLQPSLQTVWVSKTFDPLDQRPTMPAPRHKIINQPKSIADLPPEWAPPRQRSLRDINRSDEEKHLYPSLRTTRSEDWSTLREMHPSSGRPVRIEPENWGTSMTDAPIRVSEITMRQPMINSSMTRYMDDMNAKHRSFRMF